VADNGVSAAEHAALSQRVTGIEGAVASIRDSIDRLVSKFDERSRMPWGTILAGATLFWMIITSFVTIGGGVVAWGLLSQNAHIVDSLREFRSTYENNRLVSREDTNAKFSEITGQLSRSVPREEHQQIWTAQSNTDRDQQRQLDEIKAQLSGLYGARDFFKDVQDRLDRLERRE
jgi:biopolymer transport protein ExbB/TolQ